MRVNLFPLDLEKRRFSDARTSDAARTSLASRLAAAAWLIAAALGGAPLLGGCQPCDCAVDDDPLPLPDPEPDPDDVDDRDRFRPGRMALEGRFAYDPALGQATSWRDGEVEHQPSIYLRMTDDRYLGTQDERYRCRVALVPTGPSTATPRSFVFSFGGADPERSYRHLMIELEAGTFEVVDAPYEARSGARVQGCIEVEEDPERGFSLRFAEGSAVEWASRSTWGLGVGDLAPLVRDEVLAYPATSYVRELWDFGFIGGGSARFDDGRLDYVAPTGIGLGYALDETNAVVYDRGLEVMLPSSGFDALDSDEARPARALYEVIAFFAVTFE
jgi:hypothetical protein